MNGRYDWVEYDRRWNARQAQVRELAGLRNKLSFLQSEFRRIEDWAINNRASEPAELNVLRAQMQTLSLEISHLKIAVERSYT
jgi:hypothetical protein